MFSIQYVCFTTIIIGGDAVSFTNGFPSSLVYRIFPLSPSQSTRLIPEMNFICNGTIVGYTIAGDIPVTENHQIQVWREKNSDHGVQYNKLDKIRIDRQSLCAGGLRMIHSNYKVFHCNLTTTGRVSVQSGDILGLRLPPNSGLAFATATKAPTNYVFREGVSSPVALANNISTPTLLPQITLEIEPGINNRPCTKINNN